MRAEKWEYSTVHLKIGGIMGPKVNTDALNAELNLYGDAGWELVNAFDISKNSGMTSGIMAVFKRSRG